MGISLKKTMLAIGLGLAVSTQAQALDTVLYTKLANDTIQEANSGFVANITHLIKVQEQLVELGKKGAHDYIQRHPEHKDILGTVVDNADNMMNMSLDEIEDQWHMGKFMKSKGHDLEKLDHFGELFSLMDAIIHPATSYIALKEYKRTRKSEHLARASAELIEVVEHVAHIGHEGGGTQFSSN
ncbi:MAG: hypothetical protein OEZ43_13265 [Gammaproteobacteria bacterium]|nr:hypothetical protein [Gammaproteobacteria bacterium]